MRLLANEDFPFAAVMALRAAGHDVLWARTDMSGCSDTVVLSRALRESRLILTFDKDFGELAFAKGRAATCGVILFRFGLPSPELVAERAVDALESQIEWTGQFAVVDETRIRLRPLPGSRDSGLV